MSFLSRLGKGALTHMLTGSFTGGVAAALTNNMGIGLGAGLGMRLLGGGMGMGMGMMGMWGGGMGYGGWGMGMGYGMGAGMYNMAYNGMYDSIAMGNSYW